MSFHPPDALVKSTYNLRDLTLTPFGKHTLLRTEDGHRFLLKPIAPLHEDIGMLYKATDYLRQKGFLSALPWVTSGKSLFIPWQNQYWALVPWIYGKPAPVYSPAGLPVFIGLFHRLHQIGQDCPYGKLFLPMSEYKLRLQDLENVYQTDRSSSWADHFRNMIPKLLPSAQRSFRLMKLAPHALTLCHGDPSAANTIRRADGQWVLVDWDRLSRAPRWWELAQIARRFGYINAWRPEAMDKFYRSLLRITMLTEDEKSAFLGALLFPQEIWRLGYQYFCEKRRPETWYHDKLALILKWDQRRNLILQQWKNGLSSKEER